MKNWMNQFTWALIAFDLFLLIYQIKSTVLNPCWFFFIYFKSSKDISYNISKWSIVQVIVVILAWFLWDWAAWPFYWWALLLLVRAWTLCEWWVKFTTELLEFLQINVRDWFSCSSQCLFKVLSCNLWNWVEVLSLTTLLDQSLHPNFSFNWLK